MRWALTVLAAILVLGIADESSKMTTGLTFFALQTQGVSKTLAIDEASSIRTPTMALAVSLPLGLWILVCLWTPTSGLGKALRFGLWPPVLLSSFLGGPIALALRGIQTQLLSVSETFIGLIVLSIPATTCFIFLGFKLRREMPDNTNRHNMKKYFYSNGQDKEGPVTLEELKQKDITPQTLIWFEGLDDWKEAESVDELKEIFELSPPSIEKENHTSDTAEANELSPENNSATTNSCSVKNQVMFSNPFSFDGRIRRTEYRISLIIFVGVSVFLNSLVKSGESPIVVGLVYIPMYWFIWAQGAKRCHDLGNNGWWQIIPLYVFWLIFANADSGINQYAKNPKG